MDGVIQKHQKYTPHSSEGWERQGQSSDILKVWRGHFCVNDVKVQEFGIQAAEREKLTIVSPSCELDESLYQYAWQDVLKGTVVA